MGGHFFNLRLTYISNMSVLLALKLSQQFPVGGWWWSKAFRVPFWSKPWTLDLKLFLLWQNRADFFRQENLSTIFHSEFLRVSTTVSKKSLKTKRGKRKSKTKIKHKFNKNLMSILGGNAGELLNKKRKFFKESIKLLSL